MYFGRFHAAAAAPARPRVEWRPRPGGTPHPARGHRPRCRAMSSERWSTSGPLRCTGRPRLHRSLRLRPEAVVNLSRMGRALLIPDGRSAFFTAARSVMYPLGQRGSMLDMGFLAPDVPTLIVWSEKDADHPGQPCVRGASTSCRAAPSPCSPAPATSRIAGTRNASPTSWPSFIHDSRSQRTGRDTGRLSAANRVARQRS